MKKSNNNNNNNNNNVDYMYLADRVELLEEEVRKLLMICQVFAERIENLEGAGPRLKRV